MNKTSASKSSSLVQTGLVFNVEVCNVFIPGASLELMLQTDIGTFCGHVTYL